MPRLRGLVRRSSRPSCLPRPTLAPHFRFPPDKKASGSPRTARRLESSLESSPVAEVVANDTVKFTNHSNLSGLWSVADIQTTTSADAITVHTDSTLPLGRTRASARTTRNDCPASDSPARA
eukprot:1276215-Pyramimonas_sp.AAC.1